MGAPMGNKNAAGSHKYSVSRGAKHFLKRTKRGIPTGSYKGSKAQKYLTKQMNPYVRKRLKYERATRPIWARGAHWSPRDD